LLAKQIYDGVITSKLLEQFTALVRKTIASHINDIISDRLKNAIEIHKDGQTESKPETKKELPDGVVYMSDDGTIVTTQEEIDAFNIVRAILYESSNIEKITYRDAQSYFAVLFDDNNRKPICRMYFNSQTVKYVSFFDRTKKEFKNKIDSISDIYKYSNEIKDVVSFYSEKEK
jgi:hypothetical protein